MYLPFRLLRRVAIVAALAVFITPNAPVQARARTLSYNVWLATWQVPGQPTNVHVNAAGPSGTPAPVVINCTKYVATTGSDAAPGTLAQPWQHVAYAVGASSSAAAGDTICVRAGTYNEYIQPGKSGTASAYITLSAYPGEDCSNTTLPQTDVAIPTTGCATSHAILTGGGALGNFVDEASRGYWIVNGFEITGSTGGAGIYLSDNSHDYQLYNNYVHATNSGDNASCIFLQRVVGSFIVSNNRLHSCDGTNAGNNTGIVIFGQINGTVPAVSFIIYHNQISNEGVGIKIKHPFATATASVFLDIGYNRIHDLYHKGGVALATGSYTANKIVLVHHNEIYRSTVSPCIELGDDFGNFGAEVYQNTCYNTQTGIHVCNDGVCNSGGSAQNWWHDNIFVPVARSGGVGNYTGFAAVQTQTTNTPIITATTNFNCYGQASGSATDLFVWGATAQTFTQWKAQAGVNPADLNSLVVNPSFTNTATYNLTLQAGSSCKNMHGNGRDAGAFETGTETPGIVGTPFFNEGFEISLTTHFASTTIGSLGDYAEFARQSSVVASGSWALDHTITNGNLPNFGVQHFGDDPVGSPILPGTAGLHFRTIHFQYRIRYALAFNFNPPGTKYKQAIFGSTDGVAHNSPNPWTGDYGITLVQNDGTISAELNDRSTTGGAENVDLLPNLGTTADRTVSTNVWNVVEVRRTLNTPGSSDGTFEMWLNFVKVESRSNVRWRVPVSGAFGTNNTYGTNFFMISDYAQPPNASSHIYWDDVKFSTSYIGQ